MIDDRQKLIKVEAELSCRAATDWWREEE